MSGDEDICDAQMFVGLRLLEEVAFLYKASHPVTAVTMLLASGRWASMLCWRNEFFYWSKFFSTNHGQSSTFGVFTIRCKLLDNNS